MKDTTITTADPVLAPRFEGSGAMRLPAPPEAVFPLLCPVREYDWIPHWRCELLHTASGAAERGCAFRTTFADCGPETWLCTRHEPPRAVEYVRFAELGLISHLAIALAPDGAGGTTVLWTLARTATAPGGREYLAGYGQERYQMEMRMLEDMLRHYLRTGTALPARGA